MRELKKKILFNKNHISVEEISVGISRNMSYIVQKKDRIDNKYAISSRFFYPTRESEKYHIKTIEEIKESPLGFYYKQEKTIKELKSKYKEKKFDRHPILYKTHCIYGPKYNYYIKYPYNYNESYIGTDIRPYDIADTNGIEDHFIFDLKRILDTIFEICNKDKINLKETKSDYFDSSKNEYEKFQIGELKKEVYIDIFGFPEGPLALSNNDKILSHGFDLKESFRKRKENDNK